MHSLGRLLICASLVLGSASAALSQDDDPIEVTTEVVNVSIAVTGKDGKPVDGLTKADFELFDNKKKTEIAFFSNRDAPVSYGIVYDLHPATSQHSAAILRSLEAFTDGLGKQEDFFLMVFNEYGSLNINFVPTIEQINRHLSFGERNEPNSLYDAVFFAGDKLRNRPNQKRTLIIISDGKDRQSHHSFKELKRLLGSFSVQIYAVILGEEDDWNYDELVISNEVKRLPIDESELDKAAIKALSSASGGDSSTPQSKNSIELFKIFERIANDMRGRYSLGFYPVEGGSHKLEVRLTGNAGRKLNLSYRKSYLLPEKQ